MSTWNIIVSCSQNAQEDAAVEFCADATGFSFDSFAKSSPQEIERILRIVDTFDLPSGSFLDKAKALFEHDVARLHRALVLADVPIDADGRFVSHRAVPCEALPPLDELTLAADKCGVKVWRLKFPYKLNTNAPAY
jgi:hypothetical protein